MFQNQRNMIIPTIFVFNEIQRDTQKHLRDILSWKWYEQHNTKHSTMLKNDEQTCKHVEQTLYQQNPCIKLIKTSTKPYSTTIFPYLNIYTKSKKTRTRNLKYIENNRKLIPFLEDWWRKWRFWERERRTRQGVCIWCEGKLNFFWKLS